MRSVERKQNPFVTTLLDQAAGSMGIERTQAGGSTGASRAGRNDEVCNEQDRAEQDSAWKAYDNEHGRNHPNNRGLM